MKNVRDRKWNKYIVSSNMNARRIELLYYPVFKGLKLSTKEELQRMITSYLIHHPELRPQKHDPWYCSKVSPGFNHETVDCYFIVAPQPLKELEHISGMVRYSSIELYSFLKRGTILLETSGKLPKKFKLVWMFCLHHTFQVMSSLKRETVCFVCYFWGRRGDYCWTSFDIDSIRASFCLLGIYYAPVHKIESAWWLWC